MSQQHQVRRRVRHRNLQGLLTIVGHLHHEVVTQQGAHQGQVLWRIVHHQHGGDVLSTRVEAFTVKGACSIGIPAKYTVQRASTRIRAGDCTPPCPSGRCSSACSKSKLRTWAWTVANPSPRAASRIVALCCKNSVAAGSSCDSRSRSWVSTSSTASTSAVGDCCAARPGANAADAAPD